ncbi:FtsX-like permease family protein [Xylanimonas allomyrinae]|uniref:FtsX-like permease family protein n=1 Tax=Xylanimonas allomyrinae TaxID=2509459 RepID=A0A4P6EM11_9MICO|nr:FtsX-like permease family protein [Xylanimonas allomyrinae]QAY63415.1 FtsX-like permease family protein [Xylanimonas allomyrinae]
MLRLTLAQMRRSIGRLTAAGIAIVIGTAFVAATLLAGGLITRSTYDSIAAQYASADLVVEAPPGASLTKAQLDSIRTTAGVAAAADQFEAAEWFEQGNRTIYQRTIGTTDPRLMPLTLAEGAWPSGPGEVALPPDLARRLNTSVGGTVGMSEYDEDGEATTGQVMVTGLVEDPKGAFGAQGGAAVIDSATLHARAAPVTQVAVLLADGASLAQVRDALDQALPSGVGVVTPHEHAAATARAMTGGQDVIFLVFVLTFAAIALLVAGLVITNTFQVLVAQRTRTLAMLRAVGAGKRQVGAGVLLEAALLGVVASATGVAVGCGLGQAALLVAGAGDGAATLPSAITVTWQVVVIPLLVGTAVTVLAALVPARAATRVAPLAALRPDTGPSVEKGSGGRVRLVLSLLAIVGGLGLLGGGVALGLLADQPDYGLVLGIAGGATSFVGVAVSAVFWLPRVASAAGRLVGLTGPTARLAAANTLRNPRRTATTSTALLIGVTLVAMMSTGAASARASLDAMLDGRFPVDVLIASGTMDDDGPVSLPASIVAAVEGSEGVTSVAQPASAEVTIDRYFDADGNVVTGHAPEGVRSLEATVTGVDPAAAQRTLADRSALDALTPGTVVVGTHTADAWSLADGDRITLRGADGSAELTVAVAPVDQLAPLMVVPADLSAIDTHPDTSTLWVSLSGDAAAVGNVQDAVADTGEPASVEGAAIDRATFDQVIDTALGIVVGLLAVAVVIALIGVANTLSLSVLERRRESATLRAIGVTRGQLRWMLAVEGMLIAGVGAVLGIVLGLVYGWAGSLTVLSSIGPIELSVPWRDVALVAVIALAAGLVASVAPGRSAARPSPVAALATE